MLITCCEIYYKMKTLNEREYNVFFLYIAKEKKQLRNKKAKERENDKRTSSLIEYDFIKGIRSLLYVVHVTLHYSLKSNEG